VTDDSQKKPIRIGVVLARRTRAQRKREPACALLCTCVRSDRRKISPKLMQLSGTGTSNDVALRQTIRGEPALGHMGSLAVSTRVESTQSRLGGRHEDCGNSLGG